jgi:hypothetical protein
MSQEEYIAILFHDCGYETAAQRKAWLQLRFGSQYRFADDLASGQKSMAIGQLKAERLERMGLSAGGAR